MKSAVSIFGDRWYGSLLALHCVEAGIECELWQSRSDRRTDLTAVYIGDGDPLEVARLRLGSRLADRIWEISALNQQRCRDELDRIGCSYDSSQVVRTDAMATASAEDVVVFDGVLFLSALDARLRSKAVKIRPFDRIVSVNGSGLKSNITVTRGRDVDQVESTIAVLITESIEPGAVPWLGDKRIGVSISSIDGPIQGRHPGLTFFHQGADYAVCLQTKARFSSYRSLYSDGSVGMHAAADPKAVRALETYFQAHGWLVPDGDYRTAVSYESISCDGLPIVGPLMGAPTVSIATAFAARAPNFLFAIAPVLQAAILGHSVDSIAPFSTTRFL